MNINDLFSTTPQTWSTLYPAQLISYAPVTDHGIELYIKREDLLNPTLSGNKLYKLHGHLQAALASGSKTLISFGGYYSNHLHALAVAGKYMGLKTVGYIRGHRPEELTATLKDCLMAGMELHFLSRQDYRKKTDSDWLHAIKIAYQQAYVIPEGGQGPNGLRGCGSIFNAIRTQLGSDNMTVCVACGTGTTLAGLLSQSVEGDSLLGFSALKLGNQKSSFKNDIKAQLESQPVAVKWDIVADYHFGGFAKHNVELIEFMEDFERQTQVPLDPVYTAKMFYGIRAMAEQGFWPKGHRLVAIHSGGLQGRRGKPTLDSTVDKQIKITMANQFMEVM